MKKMMLMLTFSTVASFAAYAEGFEVHEWGTFTSFMGSDGRLQEGLHHEDEPLPAFVYGLKNAQVPIRPPVVVNPRPPRRPCFNFKVSCEVYDDLVEAQKLNLGVLPENPLSAGITQKMETPVIYFYGNSGLKVNVEIDFPKGLITQYYPRAKDFFPAADRISDIGPSRYEFELTLKDRNFVGTTPVTHPESIWNPARAVNANTIDIQGENEKFIFYRGIGDFDIDLRVHSPAGEKLVLNNVGGPIADAFILNSDGVKGEFRRLGAIDDTLNAEVPALIDASPSFNLYVAQAKKEITQALVKSGLFQDEALALVNTWERSYFHTPGKRVLYILNRAETDVLLPLKIHPVPDKVVRTLVGRIEIMTQAEEEANLALLSREESIQAPEVFGRFYEPKLRRLFSLALTRGDERLKTKILNLLSE